MDIQVGSLLAAPWSPYRWVGGQGTEAVISAGLVVLAVKPAEAELLGGAASWAVISAVSMA